jgi:DNA-binding transcriptional MerR regulator
VRIGELAHRSGVEPSAIRYYERIGLMPGPARNDSGYRDYDEEAAARLGFIRAAQSVGLTLGEIRETLAFRDRGEAPCSHVAALIERNAAQLRQRITALEAMQRDLERLAKKARAIAPEDVPGAAFCHIIEG